MTEELEQEIINTDAPERTASTQMQEAMWGDDKPIVNNVIEEKPVVQQEQQSIVEEVPVPTSWLKKEFDIEDPAILKAEREELKTFRERVKDEKPVEFKNEESRKVFEYLKEDKIDDVYSFLQTQKTVSKLLDGEVDEKKAADIIKFNLSNKKDFTEADVERKFNRQYGIPKEPIYDELKETEDEFKVRQDEWKEKVSEIKADMILDAKELKPNLEKLKSELVLPDIKRKENQQQPLSQEDLKAIKENADEFSKFADTVINSFNGFTVQVKDKDVDYPVSYGSSQDEKTFIATELKSFAESNFDANALLAKRWVENDGKTIKVEQMVKDLSRIYYGEKAEQKIALDAANKRMDEFLKSKKQINVNETTKTSVFVPNDKTKSEQMQEQFWGN